MQTIEKQVYAMMMTSTGEHMCDSGFGERGRAWQRNQIDFPTLESVQASNPVSFEQPLPTDMPGDSSDITFSVNVYHHLVNNLDLDETCRAFNTLPCENWDSEKAYGMSIKQEKWLEKHGLVIGDTWDSYNGECNLSQTLQGANVNMAGDESNFEFPTYILLQLHQGADVRGGYTDAKLFKVTSDSGYFDTNPTVYGEIDGVQVDTAYNGYSLTTDNGEVVPVKSDSAISLYLV
jgi:hypothetical protein